MKGVVITYREASKKYPNKCYWQHNIKKNFFKGERTTKTIAFSSSEFPMKTLGCLWPPSALEWRRGFEGRESVVPWRTGAIRWERWMLSLSRQEGQRYMAGLSWCTLDGSTQSPRLWGREGWKVEVALWGWWRQPTPAAARSERIRSRLRFRRAPRPSFYP